jgi:hypothetical protein
VQDVVIGSHTVIDMTLTDAAGDAVTTFTGASTLACQAWPGDDQAATFTPTLAWIDATAGTVRLTITGTDTATLSPGVLNTLLAITAGGVTYKRPGPQLRLIPAPGTGAAVATPHTFDDCLRVCPWIEQAIPETMSFASDLSEHRARAWYRFTERIVKRYAAQFRGGRHVVYPPTIDDPSEYIRDAIAAGYLITTGSRGDAIKDVLARWTVAMLLESLIMEQGGTPYAALANRYYRQVEAQLAGLTVELDTDGDGEAEIWVPMGMRSSR